LLRSRNFWIVFAMLAAATFFHYFTPQTSLEPFVSLPLSRHAAGRIIFLLPVTAAAFAFGQVGGIITLVVSIVIMLPRALFLSLNPADAIFEVMGIAVVGYIITWIIAAQDREKRLRQRAVEELETLNSISAILCQSTDLNVILDQVLERLFEIVGSHEPRGAILLLDPWAQELNLRVQRGMPPAFEKRAVAVPLEECLCGTAAELGEVHVVTNPLADPRHTRCTESEPHIHVCIPLHSRQRLLGTIDLHLNDTHPVDALDLQLLASIGRQVGAAAENARLCENLRFYLRQITQAQESERQRIARDLHDVTAQGLVDLSRRLDAFSAAPSVEKMDSLQRRIDIQLRDIRRFCRDLRPSVLDDLGLLPALRGLIADLGDNGLKADLQATGQPRRLPSDAELALYRVAQEALNNVRRHANATDVKVSLDFETDQVRLTIKDNGAGFELPGRTSDLSAMGRYGLVGIEERAHLLKGKYSVQSKPGGGTQVTVELPV
jgi:signal transduction histidine kinase